MHNPLMLEGQVMPDPVDDRVARLEEENQELKHELLRLQQQVLAAKSEAARSVAKLRQTLKPLYDSMRLLFGEMDAIGGGEETPAVGSREQRVWESWKAKLGGMSAKFIDALLMHGELSVAQLRVAMQCRQQTVYDTASKLGKLGLLTKNGNKYSLKKL